MTATKKAKAKKRPAPVKKGVKRNKKGQFLKGHAPQGGRPKESFSVKDIIRQVGKEKAAQSGKWKDRSKLEMVIRQVFMLAMKGKIAAVQFIADRLEGKPKQSLELEDKRGPLSHLQGLSDAELAAMEKELERIKSKI